MPTDEKHWIDDLPESAFDSHYLDNIKKEAKEQGINFKILLKKILPNKQPPLSDSEIEFGKAVANRLNKKIK